MTKKNYHSVEMEKHIQTITDCLNNSGRNTTYWRLDALNYNRTRGRDVTIRHLETVFNVYPTEDRNIIKVVRR